MFYYISENYVGFGASKEGEGMSAGVIAAIVISIAIVPLIVAIIAFLCLTNRRKYTSASRHIIIL